jgi:hypothetical protein
MCCGPREWFAESETSTPAESAAARCLRDPAGAVVDRIGGHRNRRRGRGVQRKLPAKNTLTPADADVSERVFRAKMQSVEGMGNDVAASTANRGISNADPPTDSTMISDAPKLFPVEEEDQGAAALMKPVRKRDKAHRDFVCSQPCLICGRRPSDAHHIRFGQPRALGRRVSDEFTVHLCRVHHRDLHRRSDEKSWWEAAKIEPMAAADRLWRATRDKTGQ